MRASIRNLPARKARRDAELSRLSMRVELVPTYKDTYDGEGKRVSAIYLGHRPVLARGIQRQPAGFNILMANVSRVDLTRASRVLQEWWAR